MNRNERIVIDGVKLLQSLRTLLHIEPIFVIPTRLERHVKPLNRQEMDAALDSLVQQGEIIRREVIHHPLYACRNYQKEQAMNTFELTIKAYLDEKAKNDPTFAERYANKEKSIKECCKYIISEVKKTGREGFADEEIYGLAIHYYDEDNIKVGDAGNCRVIINKEIQLTDEEKAKIEADARKEVEEQERQKALKKIRDEQEKEAKRKEAAEKRAKEKAEARKKAEEDAGCLFLFGEEE